MNFSILTLGSASALPVKGRNPSANILDLGEQIFLLDCGEGTQMHMQKFRVKISKISKIFITHLHGDHYFGLSGLLSSFHLYRRTDKIELYGPPILRDILDLQFKASNTNLSFELDFIPIEENYIGKIFEDKNIIVETFPLQHRIPTHAYVFRQKNIKRNINKDFVEAENPPFEAIRSIKNGKDFISESGKLFKNEDITYVRKDLSSFAYCTDTIFDPSIVPHLEGVNTIYHEATFGNDNEEHAKEKHHSTAQQAAKIAKMSNAKQLIIGHYSSRYDDLNVLLSEAKEVFENTKLAIEGQWIDEFY